MPALIYDKNTGIIKYVVTAEPDIPDVYVDQAGGPDTGFIYVEPSHPALSDDVSFCITENGDVQPKSVLTWVLTPEQPLTDAPFTLSLSSALPPNCPSIYVYIRAVNAIYHDVLELTTTDQVIEMGDFTDPIQFNINILTHGYIHIPEFEFEVSSA